jgi:steroid 5-alpha reductase family enzyme
MLCVPRPAGEGPANLGDRGGRGEVTTWAVSAGGLLAAMVLFTVVWAVSVVRRDASLVDRVWGLSFVVLAWTYAVLSPGWLPRVGLILVMVTVWGLRLSIYITVRNWGHGEDKRYVRMREKDDSFPITSLFKVFWLQAVLAWVISLPLLAAATAGQPTTFQWLDGLGFAVWVVGMVFEAGGDWQLSRFLKDPDNRGKVMDRGLWRYTRHPNYFGDTTVWWGYFLVALATGAWWSAAGSAVMTFFIVKVSGVAMTEKGMSSGSGSKREGYEEYVQRTNAFIPGPRKSA